VGILGAGCSSPPSTHLPSAASGSIPTVYIPTTTATTTPTPTTVPQVPNSCPPGCSLPSDYDAITWLAAASDSVTIVTALPNPHPTVESPTIFRVDQALEILASTWQPIPAGPFTFPALVDGQQYLVFLSSWRGGPCVSTLYSYDPQAQSGTLLAADRTEIPLPGRDLPVPQSITLAQIRERMYPTEPFVQSTDVSEFACPE
jgi:hypothetical protein